MGTAETPSHALFAILKSLGIAQKDAAVILLDSERSVGGKTLAEKASERTWLNRCLTDIAPDESHPLAYFSDFFQSSQTLCSKAVHKGKMAHDFESLIAYLRGEAFERMTASLTAFNMDSVLFANIVERASNAEAATPADAATLTMMAYTTTGCLGNLDDAVNLVEQASKTIAAKSFRTDLATQTAPTSAPARQTTHLALVRFENNVINLEHPCMLSESPEGTIIGSLASGPSAFTDVGPLVSRRHARVFRDESGAWYIEGLGSTNGTVLIRGSDKKRIVVEAPRSERAASPKPGPVPIDVGDFICLAGTTTLAVLPS